MVRAVVDATEIITFVESGLTGHLNDAQIFGLMRRIGSELCFTRTICFIGRYNVPYGNCIMTPYTAAQLAQKRGQDATKM